MTITKLSAPASVTSKSNPKFNAGPIQRISDSIIRMLTNANWLVRSKDQDVVFYVWPLQDRLVLIFSPSVFKKPEIAERLLAQRLSAGLGKRRVIVTIHGNIFVQISYLPATTSQLESKNLDLNQQPSPLHIPIGMTNTGPFWLSIVEMDSILIGGSRRMGKTRLLHGWIQALIQGSQSRLYLWDGKLGTEFSRYQRQSNVNIIPNQSDDFLKTLQILIKEMQQRMELFREAGISNLKEYNAQQEKPIPVLVLIIDEIAFVPDDAQDVLAKLVALGGAFGIHPIIATQRPDADTVRSLLRCNLSTRFALPVPDHHTSKIIIGRTGAEKLPKRPGRMVMIWDARLVEIQAFNIDLTTTNSTQSQRMLTERERKLVEVSHQQDGLFRIRDIAAAANESRDWVNSKAKEWQAMGYLTRVQTNDNGHRLGRKVTETLRQASGFSG